MDTFLIYGAYGYTGALMAREAVKRGMKPIIAGRSKEKLLPIATALGLEYRVFDVAEAEVHLSGITVVLNCAGPFIATAKALVDACIKKGIHYVDITGEIDVFKMCHEQQEQAKAQRVILCPGAGFDIVPSDCLAMLLKEKMPEAQAIHLAFSFGTRPSIGTVKSVIQGAKLGGLLRRNHKLCSVPSGYHARRIAFRDKTRWCVTLPWADVYTNGISTGISDCNVYVAMPLAAAVLMRLTSPTSKLMAMPSIQRALTACAEKFLSDGPDEEARLKDRSEFWAEVIAADGSHITATLSCPSVYALTVDVALGIVEHCVGATRESGFFTAAMLMGSQYILQRPGVEFELGTATVVPMTF